MNKREWVIGETNLSHDAFIVDMEAELSQAISAERHLWRLTAFG